VAAPERAGAKQLIYVEAAKHAERAPVRRQVAWWRRRESLYRGKTILRSGKSKVRLPSACGTADGTSADCGGNSSNGDCAAAGADWRECGHRPYAVIGEDTHVGDGTQIGAHCVIGAGCWIGEKCRIHPRVTFYAGVRVGHRVEIHAGAVLGGGWIWICV